MVDWRSVSDSQNCVIWKMITEVVMAVTMLVVVMLAKV